MLQPGSTGETRKMPIFQKVAGLFIALGLTLSPALAGSLPDLQGREINAVTANDYPPLNFVDPKTSEAMGWEFDAVNEIGKRLNAKIKWNLSSWDAMIQSVADGQYDIGMDGITINDERKAQVDFSDPYMRSEMLMLVRADETRFTDGESFGKFEKGLVGAQTGTTNFYVAVYNMLDGKEDNPRIKLFETFGASVQALKAGDVDVVLTDSAGGQGYIDAYPDTYKLIGKPMGSEDFGFIFKKGSDLTGPVNAALAEMNADGTLEKLTQKWFRDYKMNN